MFYHKPTKSVIDKAQEWFGKKMLLSYDEWVTRKIHCNGKSQPT